MLESTLSSHRDFLMANTPGQKLFLALRLIPQGEAIGARAALSVGFVVDTSGSMHEKVQGKTTKIDLVADALVGLVNSPLLKPDDRFSLTKFDDKAEVLVPFTEARERGGLLAAIARLKSYSGGTQMGAGMKKGLACLDGESGNRRMILLTDGQTFDEDAVKDVAEDLAQKRIPVTTIGVGHTWNVDLLTRITDRTQGKPFHVVPDNENPQPPSVKATDLPRTLLDELRHAANEVVTDMGLTVQTAKEVTLERITRVFPSQTEVDLTIRPFPLGNAEAGDGTVYILEFTLPPRPQARVRIAQLGLTYQVPGKGFRGEIPPIDVLVEFTDDEGLAARIDPEVMQWVQQRNIEVLIHQATLKVASDPQGAQAALKAAQAMTVRLGNHAMTVVLDKAIHELETSKTISPNMAATIRIGAKTQTLKVGAGGNLPTDDFIRQATGA